MATNLNVTELDFEDIKQNLKNFLKRQSEFTDYDFDGSGLNILLDVLAYNTHYNAMNAHFSLNEAFSLIDEAVKKNVLHKNNGANKKSRINKLVKNFLTSK